MLCYKIEIKVLCDVWDYVVGAVAPGGFSPVENLDFSQFPHSTRWAHQHMTRRGNGFMVSAFSRHIIYLTGFFYL